MIIYILIQYWLALSLCVSVILFVRYRNHFPVVQFHSQAHIRNPHGMGQVFKTIWGAVPPEGEENPAKGGCFASIILRWPEFTRLYFGIFGRNKAKYWIFLSLRKDLQIKHDYKTFLSMTFLGMKSVFRVIRKIKFSSVIC